ncbi:MAG: 23S rRNA (pseudouridine(1915)-N(3))-methyltransferase RlmH, partial [Gammaproteobacteria bacterium]
MKINLLAIGRRMPAWVEAGCAEYVKRLPKAWQFTVRELAQARGNTAGEIMQREADQLLQSIPERAWVVALDQRGEAWSTEVLSRNVESWQAQGRDVVLLVGGADGLHASVRERAD